MLSENTTILMANGEIKDIANVTANSYVMCADGSAARVINVTQGYQKIYNIQQKTKHRAFEGEPGRLDPRRRTVYQRLALQCTAGHKLSVRVPTKPLLEKSGRNATKYKVRWRNLQQCQTLDGRIIIIPKNHHKTFPMTVEGEFAAKRFIEEMEALKENISTLTLKLEIWIILMLN
ncbi:CPS_HP_G0116360.mRNA.1.CDS.1 [Saccharomyces cerevisiae]|nr:CPS_HP_G0095540.mRNA.1.CDS.1 [Saccharomyces cerevisiae]CAI5068192.1 CPS_HP_G0116360.mRNA.1.CDS.1 [Saccharomyces cerevisiae]CAI6941118.1 CPS_HP_G0095540.mRNA.1.CDS.1 [Saccharomyces cerevisiae]CAI6964036.1 CPS_HP_G0116360.mRNA.1.CDS.1 [Saccharomyces cerevisiae]CAI7182934.1 CPS_collapsed_G0007470.mRNA.1.CDS.1 [Saccharomyces cerevisiae]